MNIMLNHLRRQYNLYTAEYEQKTLEILYSG